MRTSAWVTMTETAEPGDQSTSEPAAPSGAAIGVLDQVRERGFITTGEIFAAFPDLEPDTNELRELWEMFESRGIKVLDEIAEELQLEDQRRAGTPTDRTAPAPRRRATEHREHRPSATRAAARSVTEGESESELAATRSTRVPSEGGSFDPVRMYLKEIGKVPLLTAEQEVSLAKRIEAGVHASQRLAADTPLSDEGRTSLAAVATDGDIDKKQLNEANLRLVVSIDK